MDLTDILAETGHALKSLAARALGEHPPVTEDLGPYSVIAEKSAGMLSIDGVQLHYLEDGPRRASTVVYIHGANVYAEELFAGPLGRMLARHYHVIAFDRPGYGRSGRADGMAGPRRQAALIHRALEQMDIKRPVMVGHSWGGSLALAYAAAYEADLAGIVNMSGWCFPSNQMLLSLTAFSLGPYVSLMKAITPPDVTREWGERMVARVFEPDPVPAEFAKVSLEANMRKSQLNANAEDLRALNADMAALETSYVKLRLPVEITVAMKDHVVEPGRHGLRLAKLLPSARVTRLEGHGHMAHHLEPQPIYDAIARVIGR